jgi:hypothetical protein
LKAEAEDSTLAGFLQGIEALDRLRGELGQRVLEHSQLQRLDSKLRSICVGGTPAGALTGEWGRVKLVRSRLTGRLSPELLASNDDLIALESEIDAALGTSDERSAFDLVREYFRAAGSVFRDVDASLKEFCMRLGAVSQPLGAVLDLLVPA